MDKHYKDKRREALQRTAKILKTYQGSTLSTKVTLINHQTQLHHQITFQVVQNSHMPHNRVGIKLQQAMIMPVCLILWGNLSLWVNEITCCDGRTKCQLGYNNHITLNSQQIWLLIVLM